MRVVVAGAAAALLTAVLGGCAAPAGPVWAETWADSFTGPPGQGVNTSGWAYNTGHEAVLGTDEVELLTSSPANVHVDGNSHLQIVPLRDHTGAWTSGRVESKRVFTAPAGGQMKVTAVIAQPNPANPAGYWPAFWLLGTGTWPGSGEIDIMEDVNSGAYHSAALHCGTPTGGPCHEPTGFGAGLLPIGGPGYHTYTVIIDRRHAGNEQVRWYLDDHQFLTISENQAGTAAWTKAIDHGFRVILDVAIGGRWPDAAWRGHTPTTGTTPGAAMSVASVTVDLAR